MEELIVLSTESSLWGWSYITLLDQLAMYHARMHGDDSDTAWACTVSGHYESICGLQVDVFTALRHAGALRN